MAPSPRRDVHLRPGWRFHLGDVRGGEDPLLDDSEWRRLDVPHDWSIELPVAEDNPSGASGGFAAGGVGWYRKSFDDVAKGSRTACGSSSTAST